MICVNFFEGCFGAFSIRSSCINKKLQKTQKLTSVCACVQQKCMRAVINDDDLLFRQHCSSEFSLRDYQKRIFSVFRGLMNKLGVRHRLGCERLVLLQGKKCRTSCRTTNFCLLTRRTAAYTCDYVAREQRRFPKSFN